MTPRTDQQVLRSRAGALAQDDMLRRAVEEKENRMAGEDNASFFSSHEASEHVILSAEGAKGLLLEVARGITNG